MTLRRIRFAPSLFLLFFVVLAGLTLFSNTFQTAMLPKVTTENPIQKTLMHTIKGSGALIPRQKAELVSESGWKVTKVHVKQGDPVKKGQILVTFDSSAAEQQLLDEEARLQEQVLKREALQAQYVAAQRVGDEATLQKAVGDLKIDSLEADIARRKVEMLRRDLEQKRQLTAPIDGTVTDVQAKEGFGLPQGQTVLTLMSANEGFQFSFTTDESLAALLIPGEEVPVVINGIQSGPGRASGTIAEVKDALPQGGSVGMTGEPGSSATAGGEGGNKNTGSSMLKTVAVTVLSDSLKGGEQANVQVEKPSKAAGLVIRKELLKKDGQGNYVFEAEEKKGSLGNTYSVVKTYLSILDETEDEAVVNGKITTRSNLISNASEPLQDGDRVRY